MPNDSTDTQYIDSTDYAILTTRLKKLDDVLGDLSTKSVASRRLRYSEIDVVAERQAGKLQPDELYVSQHLIDTNIRREQSPYVQYVTQSPRAVILEDQLDPAVDLTLLEKDLTKKLRYEGWQLSMFATIDSFQANGYAIMEVVLDIKQSGELACEAVQYGDFAFISDTRDLQAVEMTARNMYFTKTRLESMIGDTDDSFSREQVTKLVSAEPSASSTVNSTEAWDNRDRSLYCIKKYMFRVKGVVNVAWGCPERCDDWLRKPRPLFVGRRKLLPPQPAMSQSGMFGASLLQPQAPTVQQQGPSPSETVYETQYPYFLFPYLISENDTIANLKGRVYLDQDVQEAVSSLTSSTVTQARRAAGLYFSKDTSDPNDDILMSKNVFFKSGCLINGKVQQFQLTAPDPSMFSAIQMLVSGNQNETSQVNFAVQNRKDSRKTAKEIEVATQQSTILSTVQVVLFSLALKQMYTYMTGIIQSRVLCGLIQVNQTVQGLYLQQGKMGMEARKFSVKPSGDVDVIEKQQLIQTMMNAWPVYENTPAAQSYLADLTELMFPQNSPKYLQAFQQAQQQASSQQAQQQQQVLAMMMQTAQGIISLSKHPDYFSDTGRVHAFPVVENAATQFEQMEQQMKQQQGNKK